MSLSAILIVFGVIFVAELPDKSMFASLALSTRFRRSYVWLGAAAAFLVHAAIAVTAGRLMALMPHRPLEMVIGILFLVGAMLLVFGKYEAVVGKRKQNVYGTSGKNSNFIKAFTTSFVIIFLGEWGDITQIATANYAAKYHDPIVVGISAIAALWSVAALSVLVGAKLINHIPARTLERLTACVLVVFGLFSIGAAIK